MASYNPWWPTSTTNTDVNYTPTNTYTPNLSGNSNITNILDTIGQYLKPQTAYTTANPVENFLAPQQEAFNLWAQNYARPQFDYWTKNPFMTNQANAAAAGGSVYGGANSQKALNDALSKIEMQYNSDLSSKQTSYLQPFQDQYNKMMTNAASSPTTNLKV